jgi:hypothetical protein
MTADSANGRLWSMKKFAPWMAAIALLFWLGHAIA